MSFCSELTVHLQKIKEFQNQLNREIEEFVSLKNSNELDFKDGADRLAEIYKFRKQIKDGLKIKLDIYLHFLPDLPDGEPREKTIKLGTGLKTSIDFNEAFRLLSGPDKIVGIHVFADIMMKSLQFTIAPKETDIKLVFLTVRDLGFTKAGIGAIEKVAKKRGLKICPAEVGPQLVLQGQQMNSCYVCMNPINVDGLGNNMRIFYINTTKEETALDSIKDKQGTVCLSNAIFVFSRD